MQWPASTRLRVLGERRKSIFLVFWSKGWSCLSWIDPVTAVIKLATLHLVVPCEDSSCETWARLDHLCWGGSFSNLWDFKARTVIKHNCHSFPSAVAVKTCWSRPIWYYRVRKSKLLCSAPLPSWIFKSFNARRREPETQHSAIDSGFIGTFTRHFRSLRSYSHTTVKDPDRFIGISHRHFLIPWHIDHFSCLVNIEAYMSLICLECHW